MLGERLKNLRKEQFMSLADLSKQVEKSASTLSRYENNLIEKLDLDLIEKIADVLGTSSSYLLGMTDDSHYVTELTAKQYCTEDGLTNILVTDNQMAPEIPEGACVQIRKLKLSEELTVGGYYYIEFNAKKVFRMVIADSEDGIGFLPMNLSERRIAYDKKYVHIIGKAVSMKVFFEDRL